MHPAVIVEQLVSAGAPFRKRKAPSGFPLDAHRYAEMFTSMVSSSAARHSQNKKMHGEPAFSFPSVKLKKWFGNGGFRKINGHLGFIETSGWYDMYSGITKPYVMTPAGGRFLESCRQAVLQGYIGSLYERHGTRVRRRRNGIQSLDNRDKAAVSNAKIRWAIPVNLEAINRAIATGLDNLFPDADKLRLASMVNQLRLIQLCGMNDNAGKGLLPQVYCEDQSGRLNNLGGISLQNTHKELRPIILAGTHEYDFENCHWQILQQKSGIDSP